MIKYGVKSIGMRVSDKLGDYIFDHNEPTL